MFGQIIHHLIPQIITQCEFFPSKLMADSRKKKQLAPRSTYIQSKHSAQANTRTWKSVKGSRHTLGAIRHTPPPSALTQIHLLSPWLRWVVMSLCFYIIYATTSGALVVLLGSKCPCAVVRRVPRCFHLWSSSERYCRKSILKAMMMQQQATQGLFRSPGKNIKGYN